VEGWLEGGRPRRDPLLEAQEDRLFPVSRVLTLNAHDEPGQGPEDSLCQCIPFRVFLLAPYDLIDSVFRSLELAYPQEFVEHSLFHDVGGFPAG
jgi:hypothetical protein